MIKITKNDWKEFFPYSVIRPEQELSINFALNAYLNSNKKFVLLECPTGVGKSAIAMTIAKYLQNKKHKMDDTRTAYITTTQIILQHQYVKDYPEIASVYSKTNYECVNNLLGLTCDVGLVINELKNKLNKQSNGKRYSETCVYTQNKNRFNNEDISLTNIPYFLVSLQTSKQLPPRKLLVVDECHNLESQIIDYASAHFSRYYAEEVLHINWYNNTDNNLERFYNWALNYYKQLDKIYSENTQILSEKPNLNHEYSNLIKRTHEYSQKLKSIKIFIENYNKDFWIMTETNNKDNIIIKPLFAKYFTSNLFSVADKFLFMSATILDKDIFCQTLGINKDDVEYLSVESPFDISNRKIYNVNIASLNMKSIDNNLPTIKTAIEHLLEEYKDQKGIIHTWSYKISQYIQNNIKNPRLLYHDQRDRNDVLNFHIYSNKPTVLVSPSFVEGVDLVGDLSRFQIIVKCMYPSLQDRYIAIKMKKIKNWYESITARNIIQASGRSVRNETDHCITYILDSDFSNFYYRNANLFPKWWKDALEDL